MMAILLSPSVEIVGEEAESLSIVRRCSCLLANPCLFCAILFILQENGVLERLLSLFADEFLGFL